jgi:hypothetical protein
LAAIVGEFKNLARDFKIIPLRIVAPIPPDTPAAATNPAPEPRVKIALLVT